MISAAGSTTPVAPSTVNHTELSHSFWSFFTSAGFGGLATFLAAAIAGGVALFSIRRTRLQHDRQLGATKFQHNRQLAATKAQHDRQLAAQERDRRIARCWERLTWLADTSFASTANPGLAPDLVNELIGELDKEAMNLEDETLALAVTALGTQFLNALRE